MNTLDELLGLDPASPDVLRAERLAENDRALLRELVRIRKARKLSQADVGAIMGISQPSVADFEAHDSNPTLAKIRRYAHAVRALIVHRVEPDEGQLLDARRGEWVSTSIRNTPVQLVAEVAPQVDAEFRPSVSGAAGFHLGTRAAQPPGRTDLALAA